MWVKIKKLLKQPSTWRGVAILTGVLFGWSVDPATGALIGGVIIALVEAVRDEEKT